MVQYYYLNFSTQKDNLKEKEKELFLKIVGLRPYQNSMNFGRNNWHQILTSLKYKSLGIINGKIRRRIITIPILLVKKRQEDIIQLKNFFKMVCRTYIQVPKLLMIQNSLTVYL